MSENQSSSLLSISSDESAYDIVIKPYYSLPFKSEKGCSSKDDGKLKVVVSGITNPKRLLEIDRE
jgi:hypothetical protein